MVNRKRKNECGAATAFVTRAKAIRMLQLSLQDFRRLCIVKGIYPQEPTHLKKAGKGNSDPKTYYHLKDIQFLKGEPIQDKLRAYKIYVRKLKTAVAKKEHSAIRRLRQHKPVVDLHHIVKERFPTLTDALRDLDDALSLCFLFATMPKNKKIHTETILLCRQLSMAFMKYIVIIRGLRKVFYAIQGIYFQVEVKGQTITWVVPHKVAYEHPVDVDYRIMATFVEFNSFLLGSVNSALYSEIQVQYPPELNLDVPEDLQTELVKPDDFYSEAADSDREKWAAERESAEKLQALFNGLKFFINRECDRESMVFMIRSCGGDVSWDESVHSEGVTYGADDETITHHVVDRKEVQNPYLSRYYIQPQWVADCINARRLLPVKDYFPGVMLPPHLSPFVEEFDGDYVPPDKKRLMGEEVEPMDVKEGSEDEEGKDSSDEDVIEKKKTGKEQKSEVEQPLQPKMAVKAGEVEIIDKTKKQKREQDEERKLTELMVQKKHRRLYNKIMHKKKKTTQEAQALINKREKFDKEQKKNKKQKITRDS